MLFRSEEELDSTEKADYNRLAGELLTANLHAFHKGMTKVDLMNYYTEETVSIRLDPQKTPIQNAQKYYRNYRKQTTAHKILVKLLECGREEMAYLESVRYEVELAETEEEFLHIRRELYDAGYLKAYRVPKGKPKKTNDILEFCTTDGFTVLVGKNNAANDKLTLRTAHKDDIWFHVKNGAGSHVVLIVNERTPSNTAKTEAAIIASFYSTMRQSEQVPVDFTEIRYVKKAPGQPNGMVIYQNFCTAYVRPEQEIVEKLKP